MSRSEGACDASDLVVATVDTILTSEHVRGTSERVRGRPASPIRLFQITFVLKYPANPFKARESGAAHQLLRTSSPQMPLTDLAIKNARPDQRSERDRTSAAVQRSVTRRHIGPG